jgi:hypothetical protein
LLAKPFFGPHFRTTQACQDWWRKKARIIFPLFWAQKNVVQRDPLESNEPLVYDNQNGRSVDMLIFV